MPQHVAGEGSLTPKKVTLIPLKSWVGWRERASPCIEPRDARIHYSVPTKNFKPLQFRFLGIFGVEGKQ